MRQMCLLITLVLMALPVRAADEGARFKALVDRTWERQIQDDPLFATAVGRHEYNDRLPSITAKDLERQYNQRKAALAELKAIDRSKLPATQTVNYDIFRRQLEEDRKSTRLNSSHSQISYAVFCLK